MEPWLQNLQARGALDACDQLSAGVGRSRVSAVLLHDPAAQHMSHMQAVGPHHAGGADAMCPMSARSIIHDGGAEDAFRSP